MKNKYFYPKFTYLIKFTIINNYIFKLKYVSITDFVHNNNMALYNIHP